VVEDERRIPPERLAWLEAEAKRWRADGLVSAEGGRHHPLALRR